MTGIKQTLKYLTPENLYEQLTAFTKGMAVTKGMFELTIPRCTLQDLEWNHMDQLHRPTVHNTYEKGVRIALGEAFAVSLTQWSRWPIFINVADVYVGKGLFYQSLTLAGIVFLHSIISMEEVSEDTVKLKDEWYIASHKLFKFLHSPLNKKLYKLNKRLQDEDAQIRHGRFELRQQGYRFRTDEPNYYNSNRLGENTIYPPLETEAIIPLQAFTEEPTKQTIANLEFIIQKNRAENAYLIWPAACPHEGGPLMLGKFCKTQIACPWHGLRFNAAVLNDETTNVTRYGFEYRLIGEHIHIRQIVASVIDLRSNKNATG